MKTIIAAGAALSALLTAAQPAQAWGPKGHQVVVYIARHDVEQYDVQNKTQISARMDALLALPTQPSSVMSSFADKGNWGDKIKYGSEDDNLRTRNWHFIDIDVDADLTKPNVVDIYCKAQPPPAGTLPSAGGPDDCAVSKIHQFRAALSNKALKDEERELALLYLMHLVGDLHQPLHAAERHHDSGGNGVNVVLPKQTYGNTLHGFWDGHVGRCDTEQAKPW
ncbi:MAG TPA: S1/P1 nuclease, partial [Phenylobacterium sp.]